MTLKIARNQVDFSTHFYAITSGLLLGMRHGIEWDHLAAIFDMTSSVQSSQTGLVGIRSKENFSKSMSLTALYAIGHGFVVIVLGLLLQKLSKFLPVWLDQVMEKIVGATLVALGIWTIYSLIRSLMLNEQVALKSRWAIIFDALGRGKDRFLHPGKSLLQKSQDPTSACSPRIAFGIGMIHGVGVETSTQIILLSTASSLTHWADCWLMLLSFVAGLLFSNSIVATVYLAGSLTAASVKPLYVILGLLTGLFSAAIGFTFIFNMTHLLPTISLLSLSSGASTIGVGLN